jgi:hypothetical protein
MAGRKQAVVVGCNYPGTKAELQVWLALYCTMADDNGR